METRNQFKGVNSIKFYQRFVSDDECCKYLADIKWEKGYICKRCGHTHYCKGVKPYSRRCTKRKHDESSTAGTMFDKLKFPLFIAFHIAFKINTKKKGMSSLELSEEYDLRQNTCWEFKRKIQYAMKSSCKYPLNGQVHVDEFPLIRLGDVILMLAEAYNEIGDMDKAITEVNKIRRRVEIPELNSGAPWLSVNTKDEMTQRIIRERAFELAGEGQRYWDIRRWGMLENSIKNATDIFGDLMYTRTYQSRHEQWPIPLVEMERNPNLSQNDGW